MMNTSKRTTSVPFPIRVAHRSAWLLLVLAGCGTQFDRLAANEALREVCPGLSDATIESGLAAAESDRMAGYTFHESLSGIYPACEDDLDCVNCATRMLQQVFDVLP